MLREMTSSKTITKANLPLPTQVVVEGGGIGF
jgi:hypothetical protein